MVLWRLKSIILGAAFFLYSVADRGLGVGDSGHGGLQVVVILLSELHYATLAVKSLPDDLVRLHELVNFSG